VICPTPTTFGAPVRHNLPVTLRPFQLITAKSPRSDLPVYEQLRAHKSCAQIRLAAHHYRQFDTRRWTRAQDRLYTDRDWSRDKSAGAQLGHVQSPAPKCTPPVDCCGIARGAAQQIAQLDFVEVARPVSVSLNGAAQGVRYAGEAAASDDRV